MTEPSGRPASQKTRPDAAGIWRPIFVVLCGVIAAAQIGKGIVALPLLRIEFGLGLDAAAWVISIFAALGALFAFPASAVANRIGARRSLIGGLMTVALASAGGAAATSAAVLFATRLAEGAGFLGVILVAPGLIARLGPAARRPALMALWGAFMGLGAVAALLVGPALPTIGWRALWLGLAGVAAVAALAAALVLPPDEAAAPTAARSDALAALRAPACRRLAALFCLYAAIYFAVSSFLPELLVGRFGLSHAAASLVTAAAIGTNAAGNIAASVLIAHGVAPRAAMAVAFAAFGIAAWPIFASQTAGPALIACFVALGVGGLCPASIFASLPGAAPRGALIAATGLLMQASHIGQVTGPAVAGFVVERWGWGAMIAPVALAAAAGLALAIAGARAARG